MTNFMKKGVFSLQRCSYRGGSVGWVSPPGILQFNQPYCYRGGQIMPLTLLPAPLESRSYHSTYTSAKAKFSNIQGFLDMWTRRHNL